MPDILQKIVAHKKLEIAAAKKQYPQKKLLAQLGVQTTRPFIASLQANIQQQKPAIIAEIKKASPSAGIIREEFNPTEIAIAYQQYGATCISVLTDEHFFKGDNDYLVQAKTSSKLPILRKDFMIDEYQIYQARAIGADCILLIVAILSDQQLKAFHQLATELGMDVLVEVHDKEELQRALQLDLSLIGINNRNLKTFKTNLRTSIELKTMVPEHIAIITESGIHNKADINLMYQHDIYGFLVGETLMREINPGKKLQQLFFNKPTAY